MSAKQSVSESGNRCLVPWSVIPVDASDNFDTILDVVRAGKYETIQKKVIATIKKNSHHKFDNAITMTSLPHGNLKKW